MGYKKLWIIFGLVVAGSFSVLLYFGNEIYQKAPPRPQKVVTTGGKVVFTGEQIREGQNVWQSIGGQELGSIWGHGAYLAPDWSADWLHREAKFIINSWARQQYARPYDSLGRSEQAKLKARLQNELRTNTYHPGSGKLVISPVRYQAIQHNMDHYSGLFRDDSSKSDLREAYAIPPNTIRSEEKMAKMNAFFFWTSWAGVTERPGSDITYTHNWPPDELVGNEPTSSLILWSGFSVIILLIGIGAMGFYYAMGHDEEEELANILPDRDPLLALDPTPSMNATLKYFWAVSGLILVQIAMGVITAHYAVEGQAFYGLSLAEWLPYSVSRSWHVQLGIFWIATSWLAMGLFMAPAISGYEPKYQKQGVNILFGALLIIIVGSAAGEWMGIFQKFDLATNFLFGHQGYEYVDLGRFWQIFLFGGLLFWLALMIRALWPAFHKADTNIHLLSMFLVSIIAIAMFYGAGLSWEQQTNLAVAEYWRWWVVHLWVEGFFEVFATVVLAFLFVRMGLISSRVRTASVLFSTIIFLFGGIIGTFHHLYFTGTTTPVMALGATFSGLEVVPLVFMGFEASQNLTLSRAAEWVEAYRWPLYCFIAVAFWNLVGAGIFGFLINPPIALYYMQGLNTTPVHAHTALFGVYGMLGIGLMLFVLKGLATRKVWKEGALKYAFWSMNVGLALMVLLSVLPIGLAQTYASIEYGLWYARSAQFMQSVLLENIRWLRMIGDTIFASGALALVYFVAGLKFGWSVEDKIDISEENFPSVKL